MNSKIEKLIDDAKLTAVLEMFEGELIEFAELIVQECLKNMENCDGDLDFAIWKTKQDFGVNE